MKNKISFNQNQFELEPTRISDLNLFANFGENFMGKKIKTETTTKETQFSNSEILPVNFVTKKTEITQMIESETINAKVSKNPLFEIYVQSSLNKCQNLKERSFMLVILEKEAQSGIEKDWKITPLPLLPREKLRNLNLALNGDNIQLSKNQNSTIVVHKIKPVEPEKTTPKLINSQLSQTHLKTEKVPKKSRFQDAIIPEKIKPVLNIEHPGKNHPVQNAKNARVQKSDKEDLPQLNNFLLAAKQNNLLVSDFQIKKKPEKEPINNLTNELKMKSNEYQPYNNISIKSQKKNNPVSNPKISPFSMPSFDFQLFTNVSVISNCKIVGKNTDLEKRYVRLTDTPNPAIIRPKEILEKSLIHVITRFQKGLEDHLYVIDQFRSIRQDLLVQKIEDDFTVRVHEESAFFAIQHCDYIQFNECLTQLMDFYQRLESSRKIHFYACRILAFVFDGNSAELNELLRQLSREQIETYEIRLCLSIIDAINMSNFEFILGLTVECESAYVKAVVLMFVNVIRVSVLNLMTTT